MLTAGACGVGSVCLASPSFTRNTAPRLQLNTSILPATLNLTFGSSYAACLAGIVPSLAKPCEPRPAGSDDQDGNITAKVVACPSAGCQSNASLCSGLHPFSAIWSALGPSPPLLSSTIVNYVLMEQEIDYYLNLVLSLNPQL